MFMRNTFEDHFPPRDIKEAVMSVIAFFDIFNFPLTKDEIVKFAMFRDVDTDKVDSVLESSDKIGEKNGFYYIRLRDSIVEKRLESRLVAGRLFAKVDKFVPLLKRIPFIRAVAVCNTLAICAPDNDSDIDLFIITEAGRVNLARVLSAIFFHTLGVRRNHKKVAGRFCLSFYCGSDGMNFDEISLGNDDVYLSYWAKTLKPVFGRAYFDQFKALNKKLLRFFIDDKDNNSTGFYDQYKKRGLIEYLLKGKFGDKLEQLVLGLHKWRFGRKKAVLPDNHGIVISEKMLKFHNRDMRKEFNKNYRERYMVLLDKK